MRRPLDPWVILTLVQTSQPDGSSGIAAGALVYGDFEGREAAEDWAREALAPAAVWVARRKVSATQAAPGVNRAPAL